MDVYEIDEFVNNLPSPLEQQCMMDIKKTVKFETPFYYSMDAQTGKSTVNWKMVFIVILIIAIFYGLLFWYTITHPVHRVIYRYV